MADPRERARSTELPPTEQPASPTQRRPSKGGGLRNRERVRLVATAVLAAILVAFALLNTDEVEVNWIVYTGSAPLIVVIAVSFAAGMLVDRLIRLAARRRRR